MCVACLSKTASRNSEERLGAATAHRGRLSAFGGDEALRFEALERDVDTAEGHVASAALLNRLAYGHAIRLVSEANEREQHEQFKAAQELSGHMFNILEYIPAACQFG